MNHGRYDERGYDGRRHDGRRGDASCEYNDPHCRRPTRGTGGIPRNLGRHADHYGQMIKHGGEQYSGYSWVRKTLFFIEIATMITFIVMTIFTYADRMTSMGTMNDMGHSFGEPLTISYVTKDGDVQETYTTGSDAQVNFSAAQMWYVYYLTMAILQGLYFGATIGYEIMTAKISLNQSDDLKKTSDKKNNDGFLWSWVGVVFYRTVVLIMLCTFMNQLYKDSTANITTKFTNHVDANSIDNVPIDDEIMKSCLAFTAIQDIALVLFLTMIPQFISQIKGLVAMKELPPTPPDHGSNNPRMSHI